MNRKRYTTLDAIRGIALLNMILYHAIWDLVYVFGFDWSWYQSIGASLWQQAICCTFIFVAGFSQSLSSKQFKRGCIVFLAGALISFITILFIPDNLVLFGVLTLIGSCILLWIPLKPFFMKINPYVNFIVSIFLFTFTKNIRKGYIGYKGLLFWEIPKSWYSNLWTTFLGLPMKGFHSTDYFPLFPWFFLFMAGYFSYTILEKKNLLDWLIPSRCKAIEWLGKRTLGIYIVHQPVLYIVLSIFLMPVTY